MITSLLQPMTSGISLRRDLMFHFAAWSTSIQLWWTMEFGETSRKTWQQLKNGTALGIDIVSGAYFAPTIMKLGTLLSGVTFVLNIGLLSPLQMRTSTSLYFLFSFSLDQPSLPCFTEVYNFAFVCEGCSQEFWSCSNFELFSVVLGWGLLCHGCIRSFRFWSFRCNHPLLSMSRHDHRVNVLVGERAILGAAQRGRTSVRIVQRELGRVAVLQLAGNLRVQFV